jgi:hypothetical protein
MGESEPGSGFEPFPSGPAPGILPGFSLVFDLGAVVVPGQAGKSAKLACVIPLRFSRLVFFSFLR